MDISCLLELIRGLDGYQTTRNSLLDGGFGGANLGLPRFARPAVIAALHGDVRQPIVVVTSRVDQAQRLEHELRSWSAAPESVHRFPEPTPLPYDRAPWAAVVNYYLGESYRQVGDSRARIYLENARNWAEEEVWRVLAEEALRLESEGAS